MEHSVTVYLFCCINDMENVEKFERVHQKSCSSSANEMRALVNHQVSVLNFWKK